MSAKITLNDKYTATSGRVFLSGTQALVRLPMVQMRRDREAGLNTATFISGYRGSPLGGYDQQLVRAKKYLDPLDITFQPGLNEDLAAASIWGSQQVHLSQQANREGVVGLWYGKGPGVDRSGDAFKHGNAAGSSKHGGVLAFAGDDHTCKSSSIPHQSDHAFISAVMPMLYPSSIHEFIEMGLFGIAMSRYSGCWVGYKVISETIETTSVIDLAQEQTQFVLPEDFEMPEGGLNLRWPDPPLVQDQRLQELKAYAAIAFARANGVNKVTMDTPEARFGIVASGKAYEDVVQALIELGIGPEERKAIGLRLYKVRMPWPLEPVGIREFSQGLEEVLIVEERRELIENQIKEQLFNWRADVRPRIIGKFDEKDKPFLSLSAGLTVGSVARAIADRILKMGLPEGLAASIETKLHVLEHRQFEGLKHVAPVTRLPHYCAGCPHNTSTRVPEGSKAMAGIGCHFMVQWMDRNTETFSHMGAEGVPWTAIGRYTDEKHRFVNLGDGTYFHSGILAVRASVAAKANITYKLLYNDAVAMTGGQPLDGELSPQQLAHQLHNERVETIYLLSDKPELYESKDLPAGVIVKHRDYIDQVMVELREVPGVTAIVYVQTCAAELRRRRKHNAAPDPDERLFINPSVCEGCGDCSKQSNCIAIEPKETEFGRKRQINQSACNKDYSCLKGFCPSFVTVRGSKKKKNAPAQMPDFSILPEPKLPSMEKPWNIAVTGVGGTGVLTIGALIGMAAHIEGKNPLIMDMAGLAQKGGAVLSHIRISPKDYPVRAPRIANGCADVIIAADAVVAASKEGTIICDPKRTHGILNTKVIPVSDFVRMRDFDFKAAEIQRTVGDTVRSKDDFRDFSDIAVAVAGDEIATNIMMLGYAFQKGLVPVGIDALEEAIRLNGIAIDANIIALNWGRLLAHDPDFVMSKLRDKSPQIAQDEMTLDALIEHRVAHLTAYQNKDLAERYKQVVAKVRSAARDIKNGEALTRTVAQNYSKLLSYKDEYEVARLFTTPEFKAALDEQFDGDYWISFNLAPPVLSGTAPNGRPKKREFGPLTLKLFSLLTKMKGLRGTPFDPFGRSEERKAERALITQYEQDIELVLNKLDSAPAHIALALLSSVDQVRGFGPVKDEARAAHDKRRQDLLNQINKPEISKIAAE
ncbi:indolepyruvate ferredoxin oxidoreductase family protein [Ahrensia kielensis]|uniref:indolepyruvate ferredoxin oxidoreductase family protein n=1 Tax=Ahrensia kielensis TaxID=76980 RepID=UPI0003792C46|nr:indolepyruvate ferredoxin oxidoreductase family protein [Ahrensia kielensis]